MQGFKPIFNLLVTLPLGHLFVICRALLPLLSGELFSFHLIGITQ